MTRYDRWRTDPGADPVYDPGEYPPAIRALSRSDAAREAGAILAQGAPSPAAREDLADLRAWARAIPRGASL